MHSKRIPHIIGNFTDRNNCIVLQNILTPIMRIFKRYSQIQTSKFCACISNNIICTCINFHERTDNVYIFQSAVITNDYIFLFFIKIKKQKGTDVFILPPSLCESLQHPLNGLKTVHVQSWCI